MSSHTPGPWTVPHDDSPYWSQAQAGDCDLPVSSEEGLIAAVHWQRRGHAANARLIAAAPELLAALDECDTAFATINIGRDHGITPQASAAMREAWQRLCEAMYKATGRERWREQAEELTRPSK